MPWKLDTFNRDHNHYGAYALHHSWILAGMGRPKKGEAVNFIYLFLIALIVLEGYTIIIQWQDYDYYMMKMNRTVESTITVRDFVKDYKQYSEICNQYQITMMDKLSKQCTMNGWDFTNFYVGYPSDDYIITCAYEGQAHVMRFRST